GCYGFYHKGLFVVHRLSTVKTANTVAVISDGQIVESVLTNRGDERAHYTSSHKS
ncbi:hypothetical protein L195_g013053, partial [Trifolium pratense]